MSQLLSYLKEQTWSQHRQLEASATFAKLLDPMLKREDYIKVLSALYAWHAEIDNSIIASLPSDFLSAIRFQSFYRLIENDMGEDFFAAVTEQPPHAVDPAEALGYCYVVTGSSLGAKIILRNLKRTPAIVHQLRYYQALAKLAPSWPLVGRELTSYSEAKGYENAVIAQGAVKAFELLQALVMKST